MSTRQYLKSLVKCEYANIRKLLSGVNLDITKIRTT